MGPDELDFETVEAGAAASLDAVRGLWSAYWKEFGLSPCFQGFEDELRGLPGPYAPPRGRLILVRIGGAPAATIAFRSLDEARCEAKRLFVAPEFRRQGIAARLLSRAIDEARACGYTALCGDTLPAMASALALYRELGFEVTGPYTPHPTPGAIYLRLTL